MLPKGRYMATAAISAASWNATASPAAAAARKRTLAAPVASDAYASSTARVSSSASGTQKPTTVMWQAMLLAAQLRAAKHAVGDEGFKPTAGERPSKLPQAEQVETLVDAKLQLMALQICVQIGDGALAGQAAQALHNGLAPLLRLRQRAFFLLL